jgi:hypothetical protein
MRRSTFRTIGRKFGNSGTDSIGLPLVRTMHIVVLRILCGCEVEHKR